LLIAYIFGVEQSPNLDLLSQARVMNKVDSMLTLGQGLGLIGQY